MINIEIQFNKLYHEYYPVLLRYIASKSLPQIDIEDVANETLTRLWEKRDECTFENDAQIAAWLIRTSRFIILEYSRKRQGNESLTDHENTLSDTDVIDKRIEDVQLEQYLSKIEQDLSEHDRLIFKMIFIERLPYNECAEKLKIKEVSLRSSISRLRDKLRPYIDKMIDRNQE